MSYQSIRPTALSEHTVLTFRNTPLLLAKLQISTTVEDGPDHDVLTMAEVFDAIFDRKERGLAQVREQLDLQEVVVECGAPRAVDMHKGSLATGLELLLDALLDLF